MYSSSARFDGALWFAICVNYLLYSSSVRFDGALWFEICVNYLMYSSSARFDGTLWSAICLNYPSVFLVHAVVSLHSLPLRRLSPCVT